MVLPFGFIMLAGIRASIFACFGGSTATGQKETVVSPVVNSRAKGVMLRKSHRPGNVSLPTFAQSFGPRKHPPITGKNGLR